jgi:two-component system chemotaxis sensor kinase CheA
MLIQFRDEVLGLYTLSELLEFSGVSDIDDICYVIVVSTRGEKIGIIVDKLLGEQEIVINRLNCVFLNVEGIAGAAIMGDGAVIPILDIPVLFRKKYMSVNVVGLNSLQASARAHRV